MAEASYAKATKPKGKKAPYQRRDHIHPRNGRWLVRMPVPTELQGRIRGKSGKPILVIERYLKTADKTEARRRAHAVKADIVAMFDRARAGLPAAETEVEDIATEELHRAYNLLVARPLHFQDKLAEYAEAAKFDVAGLGYKSDAPNPLLGGLTTWEYVESRLRQAGIEATEDSVSRLAEAIWRAHNIAIERAKSGTALPLPAAKPAGRLVRHGKSGVTFATLLDSWIAERKPRPRTLYEWRRFIGRLEQHVGHSDPAALTKDEVIGFKDALLAQGRGAHTVENHIAAARALFSWAVDNNRVPANPFIGVKVASNGDHGERSRLPYSDEEARRLLEAARLQKGARRWVPWLLAYTGGRVEEVCQPLVSDVKKEGGIWFLDINADAAGKSIKNIGSARKIPLHPALIREGFLKYVQALNPKGPLFSDLKVDRFGKRGMNYSKVYGRWQRALGITDPKKVAHSFRHRFKDLCRNAGIDKPTHDALTGHAASDVSDDYGLGYSLATLAKAIRRLPDQMAQPKKAKKGRAS